MPIDASIYGNLKTFKAPDMLEAQEKAAGLANIGMQQARAVKQMAREEKEAQFQDSQRRMSVIGRDLDVMAGKSPQERAAMYPQIRKQWIKSGVGSEQDFPIDFDEGLFGSVYSQFKNSDEYRKIQDSALDRKYKESQIAKNYADAKNGPSNALADWKAKEDIKNAQKREDSVKEVEQRRQDIMANIALLKDQVKEDGTYELLGTHNDDLNRRAEFIATDIAKLVDPSSVARPQEVEMFKKGMVSPTIFGERNSTAIQRLENLEKEMEERAATAYRVRGLDPPQKSAKKTQQPVDRNSGSANAGATVKIPKSKQSSQDIEAITWAKRNPGDPRAQMILDMHEVD